MESKDISIKHDRRDHSYRRENRNPRFERKEREFHGYYVDVTKAGGDAIRAFRKLKRMYKDTRFFEEMRERQYYVKPTTKKREARKERAKVLRRLQRERNDSRFAGTKRRK